MDAIGPEGDPGITITAVEVDENGSVTDLGVVASSDAQALDWGSVGLNEQEEDELLTEMGWKRTNEWVADYTAHLQVGPRPLAAWEDVNIFMVLTATIMRLSDPSTPDLRCA